MIQDVQAPPNLRAAAHPLLKGAVLYDCSTAPSPRRVRVFLHEKGVALSTAQVDLRHGEQFGSAFRGINSDVTVPVLQLANGERLSDIVGICRLVEECLADPPLFGVGPLEKARVDAWLRWCDREGFYAVMDAFRNSTPGLKERALPGPRDYAQIPELAERSRLRIASFFSRLDERLSRTPFVAGGRYSIADITAMVAVDFAGWMRIRPTCEHPHLDQWWTSLRERPSYTA